VLLMAKLFGAYPFLLRLYADSGYQGPKFPQALKRVCREVNLEIVRRSDAGRFVVLPKRWIVERTIGRLNRCRRLARIGNA
jgi:transposase